MTGENGIPETPEWSLPPRELPVTIPPNITLSDN